MATYPTPAIPDGHDFTGHYYYENIRLVHTLGEVADFLGSTPGLMICTDHQGRKIIFARDYERWVDDCRRRHVHFAADR